MLVMLLTTALALLPFRADKEMKTFDEQLEKCLFEERPRRMKTQPSDSL